ncbi:unnamed protein product [Candida verbasci]|uniref:Serine/threonine-protein phosphatase 2A activator n=1 Tax=Candida verbasci TaxID=1227364 RepID=A0A9W4TZ88_9ASCO|nr:unnamed protein product [Candida verbasci]
MIPINRIYTKNDIEIWKNSQIHEDILKFITDTQEAIDGKTNGTDCEISNTVEKLLKVLDHVSEAIERHPVVYEKDVSRFGKIEFKDFYKDVEKNSENWLSEISNESLDEISAYFNESWGNYSRIDYGSGHELNFICFLYCLKQLGLISAQDYPAVILKVFTKYIFIMRQLQKIYWLEPAGSHGVWGLDDYHFLPFLYGASQLSSHPHLKPKSIHNSELVEMFADQYMYFECINFINNIKTVNNGNNEKLSLRWHSPMLDDISTAKNWTKVKEGMVKMYNVEVLNKLPIIQHFKFGELIKCPDEIPEHEESEIDEVGHGHDHLNTWGDCCGIKIPSAIAASESLKRSGKNQIPFD